MTRLTSTIHRETAKVIQHRAVILSIAPCGSQSEARIGLRLKGRRTSYTITLSEVFTLAAMRHGLKEKAARKAARQSGVAWRFAKKSFNEANRL